MTTESFKSTFNPPLVRIPPAERLGSQEERKRLTDLRRPKGRKWSTDLRRPKGRKWSIDFRRSEDRKWSKDYGQSEVRKWSPDRSRTECELTRRPTRRKVDRVEANGQRPGGTGRVTRTGFCQKKRSYHKGDSIGIRGSLR